MLLICVFLAVGKFQDQLSGLMQWGIHTLEVGCGEVSFSDNSDETEQGVFTRKRKVPCFL
jgi:hypothetical protein